MGAKGVFVLPLLHEDHPQRVLYVAVDGMKKAARLESGSSHVLHTKGDYLVNGLGAGLDSARDNQHVRTLAGFDGDSVAYPRGSGTDNPLDGSEKVVDSFDGADRSPTPI